MSPEAKIAIAGGAVIVMTVVVVAMKMMIRRAPLRLKKSKFRREWKQLQAFCKDKTTWPDALQRADKLLDKALIKRGFKGKSTGERIVAAQRTFSDNDMLWFAHKLSRKTEENPKLKLSEKDVKEALLSFAQALKDLNAL